MKHKVHIYPIMVLLCIFIMSFLNMKEIQAMSVYEPTGINSEKSIVNETVFNDFLNYMVFNKSKNK